MRTSINVLLLISFVFFGGCATGQTSNERIHSAQYVGDWDTVALDEIVVAVPRKAESLEFINVHVNLGGIINPHERSAFLRSSSESAGYARSIATRLTPRISSQVVACIQRHATGNKFDLVELREEITKETNELIASAFSKWSRAKDFEVQLVVTSHFITNESSGRIPPPVRGWRP